MARKATTTRSRSRRPGSVTSYQTKAGTRWRYQVWVPADPEFPDGGWKHVGKGGYDTATDADNAMAEARDKRRAGVDLTATVPTVADYSRRWLDGLDLEAATTAGYRRIFALHVNPAIGGVRIDKVSPTRLAKLYADLQRPDPARKRAADGLSKNTTHKVHVALSAMFESARDDNLIATNPARKRKTVKAPTAKAVKAEQDEMTTWTGAQLTRVPNVGSRRARRRCARTLVGHCAHRPAAVGGVGAAVVRCRSRRPADQGPARARYRRPRRPPRRGQGHQVRPCSRGGHRRRDCQGA